MAEYDSDEEILYKAGPLPTGWSDYFKTDNVHFNRADNTIRQSFYRLQSLKTINDVFLRTSMQFLWYLNFRPTPSPGFVQYITF